MGVKMEKNYFLNVGTGTLHRAGFCHHSPVNIKWFETEEEAYKSEGKYVKPCKLCEREKEKRLRGIKQ